MRLGRYGVSKEPPTHWNSKIRNRQIFQQHITIPRTTSIFFFQLKYHFWTTSVYNRQYFAQCPHELSRCILQKALCTRLDRHLRRRQVCRAYGGSSRAEARAGSEKEEEAADREDWHTEQVVKVQGFVIGTRLEQTEDRPMMRGHPANKKVSGHTTWQTLSISKTKKFFSFRLRCFGC